MKRTKVVVMILMVPLLLSACGPKDTPEVAAKEWTEALLNLDSNKLTERTCAAQRANVQSTAIWASAFAVLGQQFTGQQVEADISDLRFEIVGESGNSAQVQVHGEIRTAVLAIAQTTQVDTTYTMVQEGRKWKWCGEVTGTEALAAAPPTQSSVQPPTVAAEAVPPAPPAPIDEAAIRAMGCSYRVEDAGEGWNLGTVYLVFENTGDAFVPAGLPPRSSGYYDTQDAYVETLEGKTYPVEVHADWGLGGYFKGTIDLRPMPSIPPRFRVWEGYTSVGNDDYVWGNYTAEFRFAQTAHPTSVNFPARPDWAIDLARATKPCRNLHMPAGASESSYSSVNSLDGLVLADEPGKLLVTFGKCEHDYMTYTAVNRDTLDESTTDIRLPAYASLERGEMGTVWYWDTEIITIKLGPGQTKQDKVLYFGDASYLVIYWTDSNYKVYTTSECKPETWAPTPNPTTQAAHATAIAAMPMVLQPLGTRFGIEMIYIPGGEFLMGMTEEECQRWSKACDPASLKLASPQQQINLDGFWIGKTEVTNAQYLFFVEADGYVRKELWTEAGWKWRTQNNLYQPTCWNDKQWSLSDHPVACVTWYEAAAYIRWLAQETGIDVRLPTEAEWEKAARGTDDRIWPWGNDSPDGVYLNHCDKHCESVYRSENTDDGYPYTAPVGSYPAGASPYGVLDMAGNVQEWTSTRLTSLDSDMSSPFGYPYQRDDGREDPEGSGLRVLRGGSWAVTNLSHDNLLGLVPDRSGSNADHASNDHGFRIAASVP